LVWNGTYIIHLPALIDHLATSDLELILELVADCDGCETSNHSGYIIYFYRYKMSL
jgi:hypothetical protein